jgi:hypothetical protein
MDANGDNEVQITHNEDVIDEYPSWQRTLPADTVGVYVPSSGGWFLRNALASGPADVSFVYGPPNVAPLAGNWDGQ